MLKFTIITIAYIIKILQKLVFLTKIQDPTFSNVLHQPPPWCLQDAATLIYSNNPIQSHPTINIYTMPQINASNPHSPLMFNPVTSHFNYSDDYNQSILMMDIPVMPQIDTSNLCSLSQGHGQLAGEDYFAFRAHHRLQTKTSEQEKPCRNISSVKLGAKSTKLCCV